MHNRIALICGLVATCLGSWRPCAATAQVEAKPTKTAGNDIIVLTLQPTAAVDQPIATIGAVAAIQGGEAWLRERIAALDIAEVQRRGRPVTVTRDQIALRIQLAGIDPARYKVGGPDQSTIDLKAVMLTEQALIKTAQEAVLQRFKAELKNMEFRLLEDVRLPELEISSNDQLRFSVDTPPAAINVGKTRIDIGVFLDGQRRATVTVFMEVLLFRQVAVAGRRMEAGEELQADSIRVERRAVGANDQWLSYSEQLLGKRTAHTIAPGQTFTAADLDMPPAEDEVLIKAGEAVKLVAAIGNLRVIASGDALQEGKLGQMIRVRNTESGRIVSGRVMARGTVEVDY